MQSSKSNSLRLIWVCLGVAGPIALGILYYFDPARFGFYPVCLFHRTTGLLCPGCGGLRALHQLLHGHIMAALRLNPLAVLALPFAGVLGLRWFIARHRRQAVSFHLRPGWIWGGLLLLLLFSIGRNLNL